MSFASPARRTIVVVVALLATLVDAGNFGQFFNPIERSFGATFIFER